MRYETYGYIVLFFTSTKYLLTFQKLCCLHLFYMQTYSQYVQAITGNYKDEIIAYFLVLSNELDLTQNFPFSEFCFLIFTSFSSGIRNCP